MTAVSTILRDGYRESNLIAIGTQPSAAQQDEALTLLNRIVPSFYGTKAGEELSPVIIGRNNIDKPSGFPWYSQVPNQANWFVPPNSRLILNLTSAQTVYLPPNPEDGARFAFIDASSNLATYPLTIDGNGRRINGAISVTNSTNGASAVYFYRADLAEWLPVLPLEQNNTFPFPPEFEDLFVTALAMRLNPRYQVVIDPLTFERYKQTLRFFKARYRQHKMMRSEVGLLLLPSRYRGLFIDAIDPNSAFESGYPYSNY